MDIEAAANLQDKKILVVGLGKTGLSCARFLSGFDVDVAITDSRNEPPCLADLKQELPDVAVFVGGFNELAFRSADIILISPGISLREPLLVEAGRPALELLEDDSQACVLELSSFQLETTETLNPMASALLNISEDHLDRYDSVADYAAAKARIFHGSGVLVVNADDENVMTTVRLFAAGRQQVRFGTGEDNDFGICTHQRQRWLCQDGEPLIAVDEIRIKGDHNLLNALAALALGQCAGLPMPAMLEALRNFAGLPHRCEWISELNGVTWINDSKATNVGAALAAIKGVPGEKLVLIMGGQGKGQDFNLLHDVVKQRARAVILIGEDAPLLEKALTDTVLILRAETMREAVDVAAQQAQAGDTVLLSPACASFDMFKGFEHRGQTFSECVRSLSA